MTDLQVKCFLEVAKYLNFTNAAKVLYVSQSHISRQISSFEEEIGVPLFIRNTKGVRLTEQGQMLAELLSDMSEDWKKALTNARNSIKKYSGSITIGCTIYNKSNSYISRLLAEFREHHSQIQIIKERNTQKKLINGLYDDYYDAILIADHDVHWQNGLAPLTLFYSQVGIVIHRSHPLFRKKDLSLKDFSESVFLRYKPAEIPLESDYLYQLCQYYGFEPHIAAQYEDFEDFLFAIENGDGVSLIYEENEIIANVNLRFIPIKDEVPSKYMPMQLTRKEKNRNKALEDFFKFAKQKAAAERTSVRM